MTSICTLRPARKLARVSIVGIIPGERPGIGLPCTNREPDTDHVYYTKGINGHFIGQDIGSNNGDPTAVFALVGSSTKDYNYPQGAVKCAGVSCPLRDHRTAQPGQTYTFVWPMSPTTKAAMLDVLTKPANESVQETLDRLTEEMHKEFGLWTIPASPLAAPPALAHDDALDDPGYLSGESSDGLDFDDIPKKQRR